MQRLIWAVLISFALAIAFGPIVIPWLKKMKFGQTIYELGPKSHQVKQGIPTMGGIIFAVPMIATSLILSYPDSRWDFLLVALISTAGFALVGLVDDLIKIKKKRSLGLTAKQKLAPQIVLSIALAVYAYLNPSIGSKLIIPFFGGEWDLGIFYIPVMAFILVGTVNSSNLLDGLDGLLAGCSMIDFITMALVLMAVGVSAAPELSGNTANLMIFSGACAGALLGYLRFNSHPAGVIMGDVGSFAIGGALVVVCMLTRLSLLLPLIAFAMMISSLSDLIQFAYFRKTKGKRIFKMAPIHHHFELSGMPETKIVSMYMIVTALLCLVCLLAFTA